MADSRFRALGSQWATTLFLLKQNWALIFLGFVLEAGFLAWRFASQAGTWGPLSPVFLALFGSYILVLFCVKRGPRGKAALIIIAVFAIAFRLTVLFSQPILSTDIYRYYWEGKVVANGFNPYLYPPDAPELSSLRDSVWELINLKHLRASYPPLLELLFAIVYILFQSLLGYKIVFSILDLALIAVIYLILRESNLDGTNVIVYAWAPLPIIEVSQTGHNDPLTVLLVFVSFLLLLRRKNVLSAHVMGLSVLSKFYPVFFAPVLFKRWGIRGTLTFLATIAAFYAPLAATGSALFGDLLYAINTSFFNGSLFPAVEGLLGILGVFPNPGFAAQIVTYVIYTGILFWALFSLHNRMDQTDLMKISFVLTGALLLLNRSFFPWYVIWIVPFLAFFASASWLLLSGTIFMGYMKYDSLPPPPYEAVDSQTRLLIDIAQYLPFYILLAFELFKRRMVSHVPRVHLSPETRSTAFEHLRGS